MTNFFNRQNTNQLFSAAQEQYIIDEIIKYSGCCVGPKGSQTKLLNGNGPPNNQLGQSNDLYIDLLTNDLYQKTNGVWIFVKNLQGLKGDNGSNGTNFISGDGLPSQSVGINGDTYLNLLTDDIYVKVGGLWSLQTNIKGEDGEKGAKGDKGDDTIGPTIALGFSAETVIVTPDFFPTGTTNIDPLIPTDLTGEYYNINNTILPDGTVNITQAGYWYIKQGAFIRNPIFSYVSQVRLNFLDSLNNVVYDVTFTDIENSVDGLFASSRNLFLPVGTYRFSASVVVTGGTGLLFTEYPFFLYGLHLLSPQIIP